VILLEVAMRWIEVLLIVGIVGGAIAEAQELRPIRKDGKYGYMNASGQFSIEPRFSKAEPFSEGLAAVAFETGNLVVFADGMLGRGCMTEELEWVFIDESGREVMKAGKSEHNATKIPGPMSEGLARFIRDGKWGFLNRSGETVIPPSYQDVHRFSEGLAAVMQGNKWGYVDRTGKIAIEPAYSRVFEFDHGLAEVDWWIEGRGQQSGNIDRHGRVVLTPDTPPGWSESRPLFSEDLTKVCYRPSYHESTRCGFLRPDLTVAIPRRFLRAGSFSQGVAPVTEDGEAWGFIDKTGKWSIPPRFEYAKEFSEGLALVRDKGRSGYIDRTGNYTIEPRFAAAHPFREGLARVGVATDPTATKQEIRWGYVDRTGLMVIPPIFLNAEDFEHGLAVVTDPVFDKSKVIDRAGKILLAFEYGHSLRGTCESPAPAPPPYYLARVRLESDPTGAKVFLVPLWDWEQSLNGEALLKDNAKLSVYQVTDGNGVTSVETSARRQVYMAVFELGGKRVVQRLELKGSENSFKVQLK
jgi:hypothetical protein